MFDQRPLVLRCLCLREQVWEKPPEATGAFLFEDMTMAIKTYQPDLERDIQPLSSTDFAAYVAHLARWLSLQRAKGVPIGPLAMRQVEEVLREMSNYIRDL